MRDTNYNDSIGLQFRRCRETNCSLPVAIESPGFERKVDRLQIAAGEESAGLINAAVNVQSSKMVRSRFIRPAVTSKSGRNPVPVGSAVGVPQVLSHAS
jgi:hypothetical protein